MEGDEKRVILPTVLPQLVSVFKALMEWNLYRAAEVLPIDTLVGTASQLSPLGFCYQNIYEEAQKLMHTRNAACSEIYESKVTSSHPTELSKVLPTPEELRIEPKIEANIVDKEFPSEEAFLTIQRNLLREDFVNPLRTAVKELYSNERPNAMKFTNIKFEGNCITSSGFEAYKIQFKTSRTYRKVNWSRSKALMDGNLVCLSHNDFETLLYATVVDREVSDLKEGFLTVQVLDEAAYHLSSSREYRMIESPGYFKAFSPVIKKLNELTPEELPFRQYLVKLQSDIAQPSYVRGKAFMLDLKGIVCNCNRRSKCEHTHVDILDEESWSNLNTDQLLDPSQKDALRLALTKELALIQGPPGTGKTYIGLKVVQALLQNDGFWREKTQSRRCPIVVVCFTNHALDQFLEEIVDLNLPDAQIIRVGAGSKSEKLKKKFSLQQIAYEACRAKGHWQFGNPRKNLQNTGKTVEALEHFVSGDIESLSRYSRFYCKFLSPDILRDLEIYCGIFFPKDWKESINFASWLDEGIFEKFHSFERARDEETIMYELNEERMEDDFGIEKRELHKVLGKEGIRKFVRYFGSVRPFSYDEAQPFLSGTAHELEITRYPKLRLFKYCLTELMKRLKKEQKVNAEQKKQYDLQFERVKVECLQKADVIGLTTTAAARDNAMLSRVEAKIMIVEEAAEILEPQLIASLTEKTEHLILIGDHKQLRPKTNDYNIGRRYKLEVSMFERLIQNGLPHETLTLQHRMRPQISRLVSKHIYEGKLQDHDATKDRENVAGIKHNVFFINHKIDEADEDLDLSSHASSHEATFLTALCKYLLQQGQYRPEQITVITPYVGQWYELNSQFKEKKISNVRITTVDNYQGEENEIILLSLVRSNQKKKAGFVVEENRVCVALSRAKCGLYCIGNFDFLQQCSKLWSALVDDVRSDGLLGDKLPLHCARHDITTLVASEADFSKVPDGGCDRPCGVKYSTCEHICPKSCHSDDINHTNPCKEPCLKDCPKGHRCKRLCSEDCGKCRQIVHKIIPACKHTQEVPCFQEPESFSCKAPCEKPLPCTHLCKNKCSESCSKKCLQEVERQLICGHEVRVKCYLDDFQALKQCDRPCNETLMCGHTCSGTCGKCRQGRLHVPCRSVCNKMLICGHRCRAKCMEVCPPCKKKCLYQCQHGWCGNKCDTRCKPCPHPCDWKCKHKKCTKRCWNGCDRDKCDKPCKLKGCARGHPCLGLCGESCPPVCHDCGTVKERVSKVYDDDECYKKCENHRYIELEDCRHIFLVDSLDRWMKREEHALVQWKHCPLESCKAPVVSTPRYARTSKQILYDINELKKKKDIQASFLDPKLKKQMIDELSDFPADELRKIGLTLPPINEEDDNQVQKLFVITAFGHEVYRTIESLTQLNSGHGICMEKDAGLTLVTSQAGDFLSWLKQRLTLNKLTAQTVLDIGTESSRLSLLEQHYSCSKLTEEGEIIEDGEMLEDEEELQQSETKESQQVVHVVKNLCKRFQLEDDEKEIMFSELGVSVAEKLWFRCPKRHYYNCSSENRGTCPECIAKQS